MRSVRQLPVERREETDNRPYLEAPSPWDYRYDEMPKGETSDEDEESPRVIVIEM